MIEAIIAKFFKDQGWAWSVKGKGSVVPDEEDIERALDEAARLLYDGSTGDQLEVGRLIIKKKPLGHDVYMFVGEYE